MTYKVGGKMNKKIFKGYPVKLASKEMRSYVPENRHIRLVMPEILEMKKENVLILNIYRPSDFANGRFAPAYRIFQTHDNYITEDRLENKWRTSSWKNFREEDDDYSSLYRKWDYMILADINDGSVIAQYFDKNGNFEQPLKLVRDVQSEIMDRRCQIKRQKRQEKIDAAMAGVKPCNNKFLKWAEEEGLHWSRFIFYKYTRHKHLNGVCTHCKQEVVLEKGTPRHNKKGICPKCKSPITFISEGRKPRFMVHWARVSKLERIGNKILYREFELYKNYHSVKLGDWEFWCREKIRTFFDEKGGYKNYKRDSYYSYIDSKEHWSNKMFPSSNATMLYPHGLKEVLRNTRYAYCALEQYLAANPRGDIYPAGYLIGYSLRPSIEYLTKLGMYKIVEQIMSWPEYAKSLSSGMNLKEVLGIQSDQELDLVRNNLVDLSEFHTIQKFLAEGIELTNNEFVALMQIYKYRNNFDKINVILPIRKLCSYIAKQVEKSGKYKGYRLDQDISRMQEVEKREHVAMLDLWCDYIRFCRNLDYELDSMQILCPGILKREHDRLHREFQIMQDKKAKAEQRKKDRKLKTVLQKETKLLSGKIKNKKYELFVPQNASDIRREGRILGHCVASYTKRILDGSCQIYFIRKADEPQNPYYTVEWRDGKIAQCRGKGNCGYNKEMEKFVLLAERKLQKIKGAEQIAA